MIPKVIHYCWFGGKPLPKLAKRCIASWQKYLPDYEIKQWDESNFDVEAVKFTSDAYAARNWAFVSDYVRLWVMYNFGGIYFDTDVEVIRPLDDIISGGSFFGWEKPVKMNDIATYTNLYVNPGLGFGVNPNNELIGEIWERYNRMKFDTTGKTWGCNNIVSNTTNVLHGHGLKFANELQTIGDITIYPSEFFCPMDYETGKITMTDRTRTIHHYTASWLGRKERIYGRLCRYFGRKNVEAVYSKIKPLIGK